ncbi:unnamed protein product [Albugo candida]|uniref:Uncharacterized protein n=1 Tax=Albugo candida TaxID=65357 RepID=A0A024GE13_9STRA|nr:unnamed protein product [Albugo candida]|eukprot:CCI45121.1 unnamed protein product [Albugo candida]
METIDLNRISDCCERSHKFYITCRARKISLNWSLIRSVRMSSFMPSEDFDTDIFVPATPAIASIAARQFDNAFFLVSLMHMIPNTPAVKLSASKNTVPESRSVSKW